jgi:hypothetical protein
MNIASAIAFDTAEREYNDAWNAPSSTRSRFTTAPGLGRSATGCVDDAAPDRPAK